MRNRIGSANNAKTFVRKTVSKPSIRMKSRPEKETTLENLSMHSQLKSSTTDSLIK